MVGTDPCGFALTGIYTHSNLYYRELVEADPEDYRIARAQGSRAVSIGIIDGYEEELKKLLSSRKAETSIGELIIRVDGGYNAHYQVVCCNLPASTP